MQTQQAPPITGIGALVEGLAAQLAGFCCPRCHGDLTWSDDQAACARCGSQAVVQPGGIVDFIGGETQAVAAIASWPQEFITRAAAALRALATNPSALKASTEELRTAGLLDSSGRPTALGDKLLYHDDEYRRQQAGDALSPRLLKRLGLGPGSRVLDVGCGAGQTLRLLGGRRTSERVGVDSDAEALALAGRFALCEGQALTLVRAEAEALPFPAGRFTHVLCRVTINYIRHAQGVAEMARVLKPGGLLYCVAEGPGYDAALVGGAGSVRRLVCCLRDALVGVGLALTGWQPPPGGPFGRGRAFASSRRLMLFLRQAGCLVLSAGAVPTSLGLARVVEVLAQKRS